MADRQVHIRTRDGREIVRYDRAGKWYIEYPGGRRFPLRFDDAVAWAADTGAEVFLGLPGGNRFDRAVTRGSEPTKTALAKELLELADAIDREASISSRPSQLYTLEAIATRLRQLADKETP